MSTYDIENIIMSKRARSLGSQTSVNKFTILLYITIWYSEVKCNAVHISAVYCNAIQCTTKQCTALQFNSVHCNKKNALLSITVCCSAKQCITVQCKYFTALFYNHDAGRLQNCRQASSKALYCTVGSGKKGKNSKF